MLTCLNWVPPGKAKPLADNYNFEKGGDDNEDVQMDEEEEEDNEQMNEESSAAVSKAREVAAAITGADDIVKLYNLDSYDDEEVTPALGPDPRKLMMYADNREDPYMTRHDDEDDDDLEDFVIRPTDLLLLTCVTEEDEVSHLDVCLLPDALTPPPDAPLAFREPPEPYVHHDYLLPAFPLSCAWLAYPHLGAVGTFEKDVEVWDLNVVDSPSPLFSLIGHTDAVITLHAHPHFSSSPKGPGVPLLASGSADGTIRLWDIARAATQGKDNNSPCVQVFSHHSGGDKVQSVRWHNTEESLLASGSIGPSHQAAITDVRAPPGSATLRFPLPADVEQVHWLNDQLLLVASEDGTVRCIDILKASSASTADKNKPSPSFLWTLGAHDGPCSGVTTSFPAELNGQCLMATISPTKTSPLKLWTLNPSAKGPSCIFSRTSYLGKLFTASFCPELPYTIAVGGHSQLPTVVNVLSYAGVRRALNLFAPGETLESNARDVAEEDAQPDQFPDSDEESSSSSKRKKKNKKKKSTN